MISANGGLPAHRYTPLVTQGWPWGSEPASAVLAEKQQQETEPESRPLQGAILIKSAHPRTSTRTGVSNRFHETWVERPMRVWRWVVLRCSLEGGMHMHMVLACHTLTPPSHRNTVCFEMKIASN